MNPHRKKSHSTTKAFSGKCFKNKRCGLEGPCASSLPSSVVPYFCLLFEGLRLRLEEVLKNGALTNGASLEATENIEDSKVLIVNI